MILLQLAARNALRNVTRTALTALTVVFGVALLTVALSWVNGVFGQLTETASGVAGHVRLVQPKYAQREELMPIYENIADAKPLVDAVSKVDGVQAVYPRITAPVTVTAGEEIGDVFGLAVGADPAWYRDWMKVTGPDKLTGRWFETDDEIVLGGNVADQAHVALGQEVVLLGQTQDGELSPIKGTVVGVVRGGNALLDQQIYLPLDKVQYLTNIEGGATEILVYGDRDRADALADRVAALPEAKGLTVQAWSAREPWKSLLGVSTAVQYVLTGIIVFISALGVWNTMMMSVLERTGEIGVMRAMGLSRSGAVFLFVLEAVAIAVLGGLAGVAIGSVGGALLQHYGVELGANVTQKVSVPFSTHMYAHLTVGVVVSAFAMGLLMAIVGSAPPALRAAAISPVAAMRSRR